MLIINAFAEPKSNGNGSQNRANSGENYTRGTEFQRRGNESMSNYYRRIGQSALGGNVRTRGRQATIAPVRGR